MRIAKKTILKKSKMKTENPKLLKSKSTTVKNKKQEHKSNIRVTSKQDMKTGRNTGCFQSNFCAEEPFHKLLKFPAPNKNALGVLSYSALVGNTPSPTNNTTDTAACKT